MPEKIDAPVPGLIFIHGGGWESGGKGDYRYYAVRYAKRGYVAASISYRFVQEAAFPACVQDAKCAVRWMRANADKYHVNPNQIAVIGGSAGGHLAMMAGYSAGVPELEGDGGYAGVSSAVQAVVDFYGPCDLTGPEQRNHPTILKLFGGKTYEETPQQYELASPIRHLDKSDPPTLIFHGTIDDVVPIEQSERLAKQLTELGIPCQYERIEGYPHTMDLARDVNVRCQWFMNRFLARYLPLPATK
jgi:acetyl esterase/lipase